eukprot:CAMPEP_0177582708 /NCGR_PEP_ID=MMETSP0419_2-20121207/2907_1 /TAXON_ID=582737 /ORGANISM="Tetraselmis sp., Strain GSL018" /LENGTH=135 /DNA_ID=CAMNT_0019071999 /DNA_START=487 /DNA_END=894 /DNA_ORIENTATION=-
MSNKDFWEHEWSRHGTCAISRFHSERAFFETALKLHETFDIEATLAQNGILPSNAVSYNTKFVEKAIAVKFGYLPQLHCMGEQLNEVWMCIGKDLKAMECPTSRSSCGNRITIPMQTGIAAAGERVPSVEQTSVQ